MTEIELKFQVPAARHAALGRAVATQTAARIALRARYFDTADRRLGRAGLALRVRKEGRRWVQTLKGAGDGIWQRLEHEVPLRVPPGVQPLADPALHDGTPAGGALRQALGDGELQAIYGTEVTRTRRLLRAPGCVVELAFDQGALTADGRRWPLCELEFELKSGEPAALAALAGRWVQRFSLTLDTRTKAERGERLARGMRLGAPAKARPLALAADVDCAGAMRQIVANCLQQVLGNASDLAHEADTEPEHLHQLRVGLRRLRTALRELGPLSPQVSPEWGEALGALFARLGSARDRDALAQTLLPALHKAGAGDLQLPVIEPEPAAQVALRENATTLLWLQLLAFAAGSEVSPQAFAPAVQQRLARLFKQVRRDAARFDALDDAARHRLRKRVKRLRYLSEFAAALFRERRLRDFLKRLAPAQEALGDFNDVCVARALFKDPAGDDPMAMFALGWLAHERDDAIARCVAVLARLRRARPFWD
ncbi:MAG TPA: CYTH and CHAD domain-containing protein [Rubrivivax sp.]|nr:CYTH and CHAD domain-containing protein [Rubrivivax sp.]